MQTLVVYYSLTGSTKRSADALARALGAKTQELRVQGEKRNGGILQFIANAYHALRDRQVRLEPLSVNLNEFDLIIIGTPVWASAPVPAVSTFLRTNDFTGKKVAMFHINGGGPGKCEDKMRQRLHGGEVLGITGFLQKDDKLEDKIIAWGQSFAAGTPS